MERTMTIDADTQRILAELTGKRCCRQRVGRGRSLSIGFGERVPHSKPRTADAFYGEWEIGTYSAAWRIISNGCIVCGSSDVVESVEELDDRLQAIALGAMVAIEVLSPFDIRVKLEDEVFVDFICASEDDDEMFHIFGPRSLYLEYTCADGWKVGSSNAPWG